MYEILRQKHLHQYFPYMSHQLNMASLQHSISRNLRQNETACLHSEEKDAFT